MKFAKALFIFRRDLRLTDNTALLESLQASTQVMPCFIFDPRQIDNQPYRGQPCVNFLVESLLDLEEQLAKKGGRLFVFYGKAEDIVKTLIEHEKIDAVYVNADYTPFSRKRDAAIERICEQHKINFQSLPDVLLNSPKLVLKDDGAPYTVYTPYARKAMTVKVDVPRPNKFANYYTAACKVEDRKIYNVLQKDLPKESIYPGGRTAALTILKGMKQFKNYAHDRNIPHLNHTTKLSAHHKFGTCSIRESYHVVANAFDIGHTLIKEFYWRDFFTQIGYHFPHVMEGSFYKKYDALKWDNNATYFKAWCEGRTGFPIVDAGMRELNATGFMHNRVRMIVASFLIKDLHVDWHWGEKYFAQKLVDYDPLVNNGNWQWAASTGCDAAPYFRIFNPWLQQKRFDPQALYIKQWVPELKDVPALNLHDIIKKSLTFPGYPSPIVWHEEERAKTLRQYSIIS